MSGPLVNTLSRLIIEHNRLYEQRNNLQMSNEEIIKILKNKVDVLYSENNKLKKKIKKEKHDND